MRFQRRKAAASIMAAICAMSVLTWNTDAAERHPDKRTVTADEVTFTQKASWDDERHTDGNYMAELALRAENIKAQEYNPVDVVLLLDNSVYMFYPECTNTKHITYEEECSAEVKKELDDNWKDYAAELPDNTKFTDQNIAGQKPGSLVSGAEVKGIKGYLKPLAIYTKDYGKDYKEKFKERANWIFITENPEKMKEGNGLHFGKDSQPTVGIRKVTGLDKGAFCLTDSGKEGEKAGCNSGASIATSSAKKFVETVLKNHEKNSIAVIPYADTIDVNQVSFSSQKADLFAKIENAYEQPRGFVNAKPAFQAVQKAYEKQDKGRRRAVVFLTDSTLKYDATRKEAVKIADKFRDADIETYVIGYEVEEADDIDRYMNPFTYDYDRDEPKSACKYYINATASDGSLEDGFAKAAGKITANYAVFTTYISKYFEADKEHMPGNSVVRRESIKEESGKKDIQKVIVKIPVSDLEEKSCEVEIPIKLSGDYKESKRFLNINYIFTGDRKGAVLQFWGSDGKSRSLGADSVYLQPDSSETSAGSVRLKYDLQGGSPPDKDVFQPESLKKGSGISAAKDYGKTPVKDNYTFEGWYRDAEGKKPVHESYVLEEDAVIYAKWKQSEAKLIYMSYGGTLEDGRSLAPEMVEIGTDIADAEGCRADLYKKGFELEGWYMDPEYAISLSTQRMPEETTMIYAKWIEE